MILLHIAFFRIENETRSGRISRIGTSLIPGELVDLLEFINAEPIQVDWVGTSKSSDMV
jgi:hypothetical protein